MTRASGGAVVDGPIDALRSVFDFERLSARRNAFLVLIVLAIVSPNIGTPSGIPAIRLEQIGLAVALPSFALYLLNHREQWKRTPIDYVFAALGGAMAITLVVSPAFVEDVAYSPKDVFELARLVEYWVLYRLAYSLVQDESTALLAIGALAVGAVGGTLFGIAQYLDPGDLVNDRFTSAWATSHSLDAVIRTGRVVGTVGNPNMFGIVSGFFLVVALALLITRSRTVAWERWGLVAVVAASTFGVVLSQSRTAVFSLLGAMVIALVLVAWRRRGQAAYSTALGAFAGSALIAVTFVEMVPPEVGTFHDRFSPAGFEDDASLSLRFTKWKSLVAGFFEEEPDFCSGIRPGDVAPNDAHDPEGRATGAAPPAGDAIARDEQRKTDIGTLSNGIISYFCENDRWPADEPLQDALVPAHLSDLPVDPQTGEPYEAAILGGGYTVGALLEDATDPYGPVYALGTIPSIILNPSFEGGNGTPSRWTADMGASVARTGQAALFGERGARVTYEDGGNFFQLVVFDFAQAEDYVASAWVRLAEPGPERTAQIYLVATYADGRLEDPFARGEVALPGDGSWVQLALPFRTPEDGRISVLQVIVRAADDLGPAVFDVDGASLQLGNFAPGFPYVRDVDPASLRSDDLPDFADSPFIGAGPRRNIDLGAFDNEYALFLDRFGILGTLIYVVMWGTVIWLAAKRWWSGQGLVAAMALGMVTFTVALLVFNVAAGSFYNFQLMAIYWLVFGFIAPRGGEIDAT